MQSKSGKVPDKRSVLKSTLSGDRAAQWIYTSIGHMQSSRKWRKINLNKNSREPDIVLTNEVYSSTLHCTEGGVENDQHILEIEAIILTNPVGNQAEVLTNKEIL